MHDATQNKSFLQKSGLSMFIFCLLIFVSQRGYAEYENSPSCQLALQELVSLRIATAREILRQEKKNNPDNAYVLYLEHYCDVVELIILEDQSKYEMFRENYYLRRDRLDEEDENDPYHHLIKAEMKFHLGLSYLKFGGKVNGALKIYRAYNILKSNIENHPDFWLNEKMAGIFSMAFANIPPSIRWATQMLGMRGDIKEGFEQLATYQKKVEEIPGLAEEGIVALYFGYKLKWDEKGGYAFFSGLDPKFMDCTLILFFYANSASRSARNDTALEMLDSIAARNIEVNFHGMEYLKGRCKLNKLEPDADIYLLNYLNNYPGTDYKKDVCNRLSWHYRVHGNQANFLKYKNMVKEVGDDLRDRDREANLESELDYDLHINLLKARLLFDGGYYDLSAENLDMVTDKDLQILPYKLEYHYRWGRVLQRTGELDRAIAELKQTIELGKDEPYTFAARAALQLGLIYEEREQYELAAENFDLCRDIYDSDVTVDGVDNRAEKGLERVEEALKD